LSKVDQVLAGDDGRSESAGDLLAVGRAQSGARIPAGRRRVVAVVAAGHVMETRGVGVELRIDESDPASPRGVDPGDEATHEGQ
jgi:hypothetical protein